MLEYFRDHAEGQFEHVVTGVVNLAINKKLYSAPDPHRRGGSALQGEDAYTVPEAIRQEMWAMLVQNIIVFGRHSGANNNFPFYRVTSHGQAVAEGQGPQPYDPDGFMAEFSRTITNPDAVVEDYLAEAVRAFNHDCPKAAAILLGAASEKCILLLCEAFSDALTDSTKKTTFDQESARNWTISHRYSVLAKYLGQWLASADTKTRKTYRDFIKMSLDGVFQPIRASRNSAGHPDAPGNVAADAVFLNLRAFVGYARELFALIDYFASNPSDW